MKSWVFIIVVLALAWPLRFADAQQPQGPARKIAGLEYLHVEIDETVGGAPRLLIPRRVVGHERMAATTRGMTLVAGISLTLALIGGGFWLLRRRMRLSGGSLLILGPIVLGIMAATVTANGPPPASPNGVLASYDGVQVEFVDSGYAMKLIARREDLAEFCQRLSEKLAEGK